MVRQGLGYYVDLGVIDQSFGIQPYYDSTIDVFTDRGTLIHLVLGAIAGYFDKGFGLALGAAFGGYELAKLASGESSMRIAGALVEFGLGALLAAALVRYAK